jgi:hypothetical protein
MSFPDVGPARSDLVPRCRPKSYLKSSAKFLIVRAEWEWEAET